MVMRIGGWGDFVFNDGGALINTASYDYTPSWMADTVSGYDRIWWCGNEDPPEEGDVIKYTRTINGVWQTPQVVLKPNMSGWEGVCVCDPAVVRGNFNYNGTSYEFAMYYTASANCSTDNAIGVAFSHDGINWIKYANNPIITTQWVDGTYGAGQAQVSNNNGVITLWHTDTSNNTGTLCYERTSTDGINFSSPTQLSPNGIPINIMVSAGISYSPNLGFLYILIRNSSTDLGMYRIKRELRFTGTWDFIASVKASNFGNITLFECCFRTGIYGQLADGYPTIWTAFAGGDYPNDPETWGLYAAGGSIP